MNRANNVMVFLTMAGVFALLMWEKAYGVIIAGVFVGIVIGLALHFGRAS